MSKQIVIATKNKGKAREFMQLFDSFDVEVKTLLDFPEIADVEETGTTFEENAILKAEGTGLHHSMIMIADDSGLVIDALDGRPGVYSARYAGEKKDDEANIDKVLDELQDVPASERTARFYCSLAIAGPNFETTTVSGRCEGMILTERKGNGGFGYDPIFFVKSYGQTMAELSADEKNAISHRAKALQNLQTIIGKLLAE